MPNPSATRYTFIAHALDGDGPFRPSVSYDGLGKAALAGQSYLVRYPRESDEKYARRCELAFFASPLAQACSRFTGYIGTRPVIRTYPHELYAAMADDIDGKGNDIGVFFGEFEKQAKARGAMCLLVDMPATMAPNLAEQMEARVAPYWTAIKPESITDYAIGDHGKFEFAEFAGNYQRPDGSRVECIWHFDEQGWKALDKENKVIDADLHGLTECPILILPRAETSRTSGRSQPSPICPSGSSTWIQSWTKSSALRPSACSRCRSPKTARRPRSYPPHRRSGRPSGRQT